MVTSINSLLAMISSSFLDRSHRIHLCDAVFFSSLPLAFNLIISNDDAILFFSEVTTMVSSPGESSSPINPNSLSWVGNKVLSMGIASQLYILGYGYDMLCMHDLEVGLYLLFLCAFFLSLLPQTLHQNRHITTSLHFLLLSSAPLILQQNRHVIAASPFLLSHNLLPLIDMSLLHLHFNIYFYSS